MSDDWPRIILGYPVIVMASVSVAGVYYVLGWVTARTVIGKRLTLRNPLVSVMVGGAMALAPWIIPSPSIGLSALYMLALNPFVVVIFRASPNADGMAETVPRGRGVSIAVGVLAGGTLLAYCGYPVVAYVRDHSYAEIPVRNPEYLRVRQVSRVEAWTEHPTTVTHELQMYHVGSEDIVDLRHILCSSAEMTLDAESGRWLVTARLTADGRRNLRLWSRRNVGMLYGLFLGSELCEVKSVDSVLKMDEIVIPRYSKEHAEDVVRVIRRGGILD